MSDNRLTKSELIEELTRLRAWVEQEAAPDGNERSLLALVDTLADFLFILDSDGHVLHVNEAVTRHLGYTVAELQGRSVVELHPPDSRALAGLIITEIVAGRTTGCWLPVVTKDGRTVPVETQCWLGRWQGREAMFGLSRDVSDQRQAEEPACRCDAMLDAVGFAAEHFLETNTWRDGIGDVLSRLGQATQVSRSYLFENLVDPNGELRTTQTYEWVAPGIAAQIDNPRFQNVPFREPGLDRLPGILDHGEILYGHARDFPDAVRAILATEQILSILLVPIFVEQRWWGFLGFDDCVREREWPAVEVEGLKAVGRMLGAAVRRQRAEESLRESEERYRLLADTTDDFINLHDRDGRMLYVSPSFFRATGFTPEEVATTDFRSRVHPEDLGRIEAAHAANLRGESTRTEYRTLCCNGSFIWVDLRATPIIGPSGQADRILCCSRDITDRKKAEETLRKARDELEQRVRERTTELELANEQLQQEIVERRQMERALRESRQMLQSVLDNIPQRIFWKDCRSVYLGCNQPFAEDAGVRAPGDIVGKTDYGLAWKAEEADWFRLCDRRVVETQTPEYHIIEPQRHADGKEAWLDTNKVPLRDADGQVVGVLGTYEDITDRRCEEERARQREAELARVSRLANLGELATGLAHELNQPLSAMVTFAEAGMLRVKAGEIDARQLLEILGDISEQGHRIGQIIRRMRDFVRRRETHRTVALVNHLVREALNLLETEVRRAHVDLRQELSEAMPEIIADTIQIEQVVVNLVQNALDALRHASSTQRVLTIATRRAGHEMVEVSVRDTGCGIPAENLSRIGEAFFTTKPEGLGMGVAISRRIIEAHGGSLWVEATDPQGATFRFTLPIGTAPAAPASRPRS